MGLLGFSVYYNINTMGFSHDPATHTQALTPGAHSDTEIAFGALDKDK